MKKLMILLFTLISGVFFLFSQTFSSNQQKALNNYVILMNEMSGNSDKMIKCLSNFYDNIQNYKKYKRGLYGKYDCSRLVGDYYI